MSDGSAIEWTEATWNPVRGCTKVSAGCKHCYAETFAERFRGVKGHPYEQGFDVRLVPEALDLPLRWRKPRRIFVNSMSDLFHEEVPESFIVDVFATMMEARRHVFQVLTKRPERMRDFLASRPSERPTLPNVWLGTSVEDQAAADERIPHLLATPAAVRFLSCEPLLGPVDLDMVVTEGTGCLDWVIVGGESGRKARPCDVSWVRSLVGQCRAADVPVFVKQLGAAHRLYDAKGGDPAEWPEDLRVRQWPGERT